MQALPIFSCTRETHQPIQLLTCGYQIPAAQQDNVIALYSVKPNVVFLNQIHYSQSSCYPTVLMKYNRVHERHISKNFQDRNLTIKHDHSINEGVRA